MTRGKVIFGPTCFNIQMTSFDKERKLVLLLLGIFLMVIIDIKSVQQKLEKKVTFRHTKRHSKKSESFVIHRY